MPKFSVFSPYGLLAFSGKPPAGQDIYQSIVSGQSDAFDMSPGTEGDAEAYATAMALERARAVQDRALNQYDPRKAVDMLPASERDYGVVPGETDSIRDRQRALAARILVSRGPREESIEGALRALLGTAFLGYRVMTTGESVTWPADPSLGPGIFSRDDVPARLFTLTSPVVSLGSVLAFTYEVPGIDDGDRLVAGDVVCVDPGNIAQAEKVTIASASGLTAIATFTKAHGRGDAMTTGPLPIWTSSKRHAHVVVSDAASVDAETRRKVHELMGRMSRGVTTWDIVRRSSDTTIGPFLAGDIAGTTTIGTLTIP